MSAAFMAWATGRRLPRLRRSFLDDSTCELVMKTLTAFYDSTCPECEECIEAGIDEIAKFEGIWMHDHCAEDCVERARKKQEKADAIDPFAGADEPTIDRRPFRERACESDVCDHVDESLEGEQSFILPDLGDK